MQIDFSEALQCWDLLNLNPETGCLLCGAKPLTTARGSAAVRNAPTDHVLTGGAPQALQNSMERMQASKRL